MDGRGYAAFGLDIGAAFTAFPDAVTPLSSSAAAQAARKALRDAWRTLMTLDLAQSFLQAAEVERTLSDAPVETAAILRRELALLHAAALALQDNRLAALPIASAVLKERPTGRCASIARLLCRVGYWQLGDLDGFCALPHATLSRGKRRDAITGFEMAIEAAIAFEQLRLGTSRRLALDAMALAETSSGRHAWPSLPAVVMAQIAYEQGQLDEAEALLVARLESIKSNGDIESALRAYLILYRTNAQRGRREMAIQRLNEAEALGTRRRWPRLVAASIAERVAMLIEDDCLDEAEACLARLSIEAGCNASPNYASLARARISLARGSSNNAIAVMRMLRQRALSRRDYHSALEFSLLLVRALAQLERADEAAQMLLPLLAVGYATGLYSVFVDGGPRMGAILTLAYEQARTSEAGSAELLTYIDSLFVRWRRKPSARAAAPPALKPVPLSPREREIYRLLGLGLSNKGIARNLEICPETVKSHIKRIFSKLGVKTRAEAVSRAGTVSAAEMSTRV